MDSNEEHAQSTYRQTGFYAYDLHSWMDYPVRWLNSSHRVLRHSPYKPPPFSAIKKYRYEMARRLQMIHLEDDGLCLRGQPYPKLPIWQKGEWLYMKKDGEIYKRSINAPETKREIPIPQRGFFETRSFTMTGGVSVNNVQVTIENGIVKITINGEEVEVR